MQSFVFPLSKLIIAIKFDSAALPKKFLLHPLWEGMPQQCRFARVWNLPLSLSALLH